MKEHCYRLGNNELLLDCFRRWTSGITNYNHFPQFGLLDERMVTAESDVKFSS